MYQLYKFKTWIKQTFLCVHDWQYFDVGVGYQTVRECTKCDKFEFY